MIYEKRQLHTLLGNKYRNHIIEVRDKGQTILFTCSGTGESYSFKLPSKTARMSVISSVSFLCAIS